MNCAVMAQLASPPTSTSTSTDRVPAFRDSDGASDRAGILQWRHMAWTRKPPVEPGYYVVRSSTTGTVVLRLDNDGKWIVPATGRELRKTPEAPEFWHQRIKESVSVR